MRDDHRRLDPVRRQATDLENAVVDELLARRLSRRDFVRRGTVIGISLPTLGLILSACGGDDGDSTTDGGTPASGTAKKGGTLRVGVTAPSGPVDPITAGNQGSIAMHLMVGEFLIQSEPDLTLRPALAERWKPNKDGSVWTFVLREGVTFNDGRPMTADDVAATYNRLSDPDGGSIALSALGGVLGKDSAVAVDDRTVRFELEAPNGNFPYIASSDTYSAIILPADYKGDFEKTFPGTGRMVMERYDPATGATFVRNEQYWDKATAAPLDKVEYQFFADEQPAILALQGKQLDVVTQVSAKNARPIMDNPDYTIINARSAASRVLHLRTDEGPWTDKRARQALALTLDRPAIVDNLFSDQADLGNDSPFAPVFTSTDPDVPQRARDLDEARRLLAEAGLERGFEAQVNVLGQLEIPDYAQLVQAGAKEVGIDLKLTVQGPGQYYGDGVFGSSPWLDATAGITDYGHRGVPNVLLNAQLTSDGIWNSAHFKDPELDAMIGDYVAALDPAAQTAAAGKIQVKLLEETPLIYGYFFNFLAASASNVSGIVPNAAGQLFLTQASIA
jgi:peptide/nickel transport system substrate-binding protein